jgi:hypothetical protein
LKKTNCPGVPSQTDEILRDRVGHAEQNQDPLLIRKYTSDHLPYIKRTTSQNFYIKYLTQRPSII